MQANTYIKGHKVTLLIDSGSTLNFINDELALELVLMGRKIEFDTTMANGRVELSDDFYEGINWEIQGMRLVVDLHALPLAELNVVLGIKWLKILGKVVTDFGKGIMEFMLEGQWVFLKLGTRRHFGIGARKNPYEWDSGEAIIPKVTTTLGEGLLRPIKQ